MTLDEINTISVLGAGTMGHGIAEVAAMAGYEVRLRDINEDLVQDGYEQIEWSLGKLVEHDQLTDQDAEAALDRVTPVVPIAEAVEDTDYVIEAVPEQMDIKQEVFDEVSEQAPSEAIFASNTSSLSITDISEVTDRPTSFCGMHFFNPPVRMDLVEVIAGKHSDEAVLDLTERLAEDMGKTAIRVNKDSPGFVVNRVLIPLMNEAAWMVETNEASMEAVDATGKYELGLPMGAFELADQVGIDVAYHVLEYIHDELGEAYEPCPLLAEKVEAGELGQKTDRGFYDYEGDGVSVDREAASDELAERMIAVMANEVAKLIATDVATPEAIDTGLELGAGFPEGPATMADNHGLDALIDHLEGRHETVGASRYAVSEGLREHAESGGFHGPDDAEEATSFDHLSLRFPTSRIGEIVIDRPHRMNTITPTILEELPQAVATIEANEDSRAILVTGEGDRAFSAGADIGGMASVWGDSRRAVELSQQGQAAFGALQETPLPVIAAIDGYCLGGGMELATAADLRVASARSTFGQPERDLGLVPGWGGTQRLAPIVGMGRAKEIIFTADHYDAEEMMEFGFVNRVFDASDFEDEALAFAKEIAAGPPIAQEYIKRAMNLGGREEAAGLEVEARSFGQLTDTDDLAEGISAFLEDRDPEFTGE